MAENALRGRSLTSGFAPLVLLVGHGSSSTNNPHASGLGCGGCGGHAGEVNARVMAAILNDPTVRAGLREKGVEIPEEVHFLGALHDTTTDGATLFDIAALSAPAQRDAAWMAECLAQAGAAARTERAASLPGPDEPKQRARDWSQVRPEWGFASCAAFIAAPPEAMNAVVYRHRHVRDLVDNGWLHLFAMDDNGTLQSRYAGNLSWAALGRPDVLAT